jgi:uncharacterized damage-inducible protein DinB
MMQEHFQIFGRYNAWANQRLYNAVERLPEGEIEKERPAAYFTSIFGTLSHILLADRLWMDRFEGREVSVKSLDQILCEDFAELCEARQTEDRRIIAFVDRMRAEHYARTLSFRNMKGEPKSGSYAQFFTHLFNHQTHHRGQTHALLKDAGGDPPPLDYFYYLDA